ncbi:MAG: hypothetical protein ATN33_01635 [Epulopiscium sp. Nele67-Bin001]|nr:MAG: hypothetical protein ATN33_01635 [Epulopiscium sp. Nele67-Bin001]
MKQYYLPLSKCLYDKFPAIRTKEDVIWVLLEVMRYSFNFTLTPSTDSEQANIIIYIDKMSRIIYGEKEKIHSFQLPFYVYEKDEKVYFSYNGQNIDSKTIAVLSSILSNIKDIYNSIEDLIDIFMDAMSDFEIKEDMSSYWNILLFLLTFESGYIRYDYDPIRENVEMHPLHHLDIGYSSNVTFKIGLKYQFVPQDLIKLLDINANCHYLDKLRKVN